MSAVFLAAGAVCGFSAVVYAARDRAQHRTTRTPVALAAAATVLIGAYLATGGMTHA